MYRFLKVVWYDPVNAVYNAGYLDDLSDWQKEHIESSLRAASSASAPCAAWPLIGIIEPESSLGLDGGLAQTCKP